MPTVAEIKAKMAADAAAKKEALAAKKTVVNVGSGAAAAARKVLGVQSQAQEATPIQNALLQQAQEIAADIPPGWKKDPKAPRGMRPNTPPRKGQER